MWKEQLTLLWILTWGGFPRRSSREAEGESAASINPREPINAAQFLLPEKEPADGPPNGASVCTLTHIPPPHILSCDILIHHPRAPHFKTPLSLLLLNGLLWTLNVTYHASASTYRPNRLCSPMPSGRLRYPPCNNVSAAIRTRRNVSR